MAINDKFNSKSYSSLIIILLIILPFLTFYLGMKYQLSRSTSYNSSPTKVVSPQSPETRDCNTDSDCIPYGSCSEDCVNEVWAEAHPDEGPYCRLLLADFECKCIENTCSPNILSR